MELIEAAIAEALADHRGRGVAHPGPGGSLELSLPLRVTFSPEQPQGAESSWDSICCICRLGPGGYGPAYCRGSCC